MRTSQVWTIGLFLIASSANAAAPAQTEPGLADVYSYIDAAWDVLTRSMSDCQVVSDPKLPGDSIIYVPADGPVPLAAQAIAAKCPKVAVRPLPAVITAPGTLDPAKLSQHGLLYLPSDYVVPGGFFNEMYGWDSYFIIRGLVRAGRVELARGMIANFVYELEHYGAVLNANRTYYLTRSQPPFLSSMVMAVNASLPTPDKEWLANLLPALEKDYRFWTSSPHLAGDTGLSRYFDLGEGPVPEIAGNDGNYYDDVMTAFIREPSLGPTFKVPAISSAAYDSPDRNYTITQCRGRATIGSSGCRIVDRWALTRDFYLGDRAMRESGFDISFRFGAYSGATHHYAPVCLNSLLYKTEKDLEAINRLLERPEQAQQWAARAQQRKTRMQALFWNAQRQMFFDYDFVDNRRSDYVYATTVYPLWAGWASREQARGVARQLALLEKPGGLAMSDRVTGVQWDLPFGWAPLQLLAFEGLRAYGQDEPARRLARAFASLVIEAFRREGTIREKYDVVNRTTEARVTAGYKTNVVGFGWTNGVLLELLAGLSAEDRKALARAEAQGPAPIGNK